MGAARFRVRLFSRSCLSADRQTACAIAEISAAGPSGLVLHACRGADTAPIAHAAEKLADCAERPDAPGFAAAAQSPHDARPRSAAPRRAGNVPVDTRWHIRSDTTFKNVSLNDRLEIFNPAAFLLNAPCCFHRRFRPSAQRPVRRVFCEWFCSRPAFCRRFSPAPAACFLCIPPADT